MLQLIDIAENAALRNELQRLRAEAKALVSLLQTDENSAHARLTSRLRPIPLAATEE